MTDRPEAPQRTSPRPSPQPLTNAELDRNAKILARAIYRDLRSKDFSKQQIIAIVAELIQCVRDEM